MKERSSDGKTETSITYTRQSMRTIQGGIPVRGQKKKAGNYIFRTKPAWKEKTLAGSPLYNDPEDFETALTFDVRLYTAKNKHAPFQTLPPIKSLVYLTTGHKETHGGRKRAHGGPSGMCMCAVRVPHIFLGFFVSARLDEVLNDVHVVVVRGVVEGGASILERRRKREDTKGKEDTRKRQR